jgi:uncharacterized protein YgiM (DUF1202 family)
MILLINFTEFIFWRFIMAESMKPAASYSSKKDNRNIVSVIIILVCVAVAGIALGVFLGKKLPKQASDTTTTQPQTTEAATETQTTVTTPNVPLYPTGLYTVATESSNLNLRSGPGSEFPTINSIPKGTVLTVVEVQGDWGRVDYKTTIGWVNMKYMKAANPDETTTAESTSTTAATGVTETAANQ